ncbi:MAG: N-acetylmuramoyl-L-alanine amidase, partial [Duncaniella sp.]|nr:N-acetylmuramoyl-L-alanine amidase [Duncaniella sp.]
KNIDQSISLAEAVQHQLVHHAGRKNNGVKQAPFWVLVRTGMPSILVELDFICNPEMESFMASERGSTKLAQAIYNGICKYRGITPAKSKTTSKEELPVQNVKPESVEIPAEVAEDDSAPIVYRIQFLTAPHSIAPGDKRLKGVQAEYYKEGNTFKYTTGAYPSAKEASKDLGDIKKKFPDAFVIKTRNGQRIK